MNGITVEGRGGSRSWVLAFGWWCLGALGAMGQTGQEHATNLGLGIQSGSRPPADIVKIDDDTCVIVSPSTTVDQVAYTAGLVVIDRTLGRHDRFFVPLPAYGPEVEAIYHRAYRLDDTSCVIPGSGFDRTFGTDDDELLVVTDLDNPGISQVNAISIGRRLFPANTRDLLVLAPNQVAWVDEGDDLVFNTGDEVVVVVTDLRRGLVSELPFDVSTGIDSHVVAMRPGEFAIRLSGLDLTIGTTDDAVAILRWNEATQQSALIRHPLQFPLRESTFGLRWPQWAGEDSLVFAAMNQGGWADVPGDQLMFMNGLAGSTPTVRSGDLGGRQCWTSGFAPSRIALESDGTVVLPSAGLDRVFGTLDDELVFVPNPQRSPNGARTELVPIGGAIARGTVGPKGEFIQPVYDTGTAALVSNLGANKTVDADDEIVLVHRDPVAGRRVMQSANLFEPIAKIVTMGESNAMLFLPSGLSVMLRGLDIGAASYDAISSASHALVAEPLALTPTLVVTTKVGTDDGLYLNDLVQFWRAPGHFAYGESSSSVQGYTMDVGIVGPQPRIGTGMFQVSLQGAPPQSFGYFLIATHRDSILITPDAAVLVSFEELYANVFWFTLANGTSTLPLVAPNDPALVGIGVHGQWLIYDPLDPRGFQLSAGLTMVF
ncbi:MAG: hypothetical protein KDB53_04565 [Planctomycetes bacterium]|nr:hypothetical protein [Planctomycetota bacterium]